MSLILLCLIVISGKQKISTSDTSIFTPLNTKIIHSKRNFTANFMEFAEMYYKSLINVFFSRNYKFSKHWALQGSLIIVKHWKSKTHLNVNAEKLRLIHSVFFTFKRNFDFYFSYTISMVFRDIFIYRHLYILLRFFVCCASYWCYWFSCLRYDFFFFVELVTIFSASIYISIVHTTQSHSGIHFLSRYFVFITYVPFHFRYRRFFYSFSWMV